MQKHLNYPKIFQLVPDDWLMDGSRIDPTNVKQMLTDYQKSLHNLPLITFGAAPSHPEDSQRSPTNAQNKSKRCRTNDPRTVPMITKRIEQLSVCLSLLPPAVFLFLRKRLYISFDFLSPHNRQIIKTEKSCAAKS